MDAITQEYRNRAERLKDAVRDAWKKACDFDGIPHDAGMVLLSSDNPHAAAYNEAMTRYLDYRRDHNV